MTCFTSRVKVVKVISTNPIRFAHWSVSVGATLLLDYRENHPVAIFDAPAMSGLRTAAMVLLSVELAGLGLDDVLLIGTGRVGRYFLELVSRGTSEHAPVRTYDRSAGAPVPEHFEAQVIVTATDSREAFLTEDNCHADLVVSVGADTHFNHELSESLIRERGGLYVDVMDAIEVGDLDRIEDARSLVRGDVFELLRTGEQQARTVISVGSPLMDALTVEYLASLDSTLELA
jgi:ornithine cyclodeaminase/alanine dehydrogenase-like protein (mu-crystallin family)